MISLTKRNTSIAYKTIMFILSITFISLCVFLFFSVLKDIFKICLDFSNDSIDNMVVYNSMNSIIFSKKFLIVTIIVLLIIIHSYTQYFPMVIAYFIVGYIFSPLLTIFLIVIISLVVYLINYVIFTFVKSDKYYFNTWASVRLKEYNKHKKDNVNSSLFNYLLLMFGILPYDSLIFEMNRKRYNLLKYFLTCLSTLLIRASYYTLMCNLTFILFNKYGSYFSIIIPILLVFINKIIFYYLFRLFFIKKGLFVINGPFYEFYYRGLQTYVETRNRIRVKCDDVFDSNTIVLCNHASFYDFFAIAKSFYPVRVTFVTNRYYFRFRILKHIFKYLRVIPKNMFYQDLETIKLCMKSIKDYQAVGMFPEGRLSEDGTSLPILNKCGALIKKLNCNLVIMSTYGGYACNPKWGMKRHRGDVFIEKKLYLSKDELSLMSVDEVDDIINKSIYTNEYEYLKNNNLNYKAKNMFDYLENLLIYCPNCKTLYNTRSKGQFIKCINCGLTYQHSNNYGLKEVSNFGLNIHNIHDWNKLIFDYEQTYLDNHIKLDEVLSCDVIIKEENPLNKKKDLSGSGKLSLSYTTLSYSGTLNNGLFDFEIPISLFKALPYKPGVKLEVYYEHRQYFLYPTSNPKVVARFAKLVELITNEILNNK